MALHHSSLSLKWGASDIWKVFHFGIELFYLMVLIIDMYFGFNLLSSREEKVTVHWGLPLLLPQWQTWDRGLWRHRQDT